MSSLDSADDSGATRPTEIPLLGGRITPGVVRVGNTVRRPVGPHSPFVHDLLRHLEDVGFTNAPRFLGIDDQGRESLSYIEGFVPDNIDAGLTDDQLFEAAELLRRYHDATAGSHLAGATLSSIVRSRTIVRSTHSPSYRAPTAQASAS